MPQKYQEQRVDPKTGEVQKSLRVVSIDDTDAFELNADWKKTGIRYEPVKEVKQVSKKAAGESESMSEPEKTEGDDVVQETEAAKRLRLFEELKKLGKSAKSTSKTEDLEMLLKTLQSKPNKT